MFFRPNAKRESHEKVTVLRGVTSESSHGLQNKNYDPGCLTENASSFTPSPFKNRALPPLPTR